MDVFFVLSHWLDSAARNTFVHRMTLLSVIRHSSITRSSPKRHERLGGPLTVLVRDRCKTKKTPTRDVFLF